MLKNTDEDLYKIVKMRLDLEHKSIKHQSLFNFLNDRFPNLIIDGRDRTSTNVNINNEKELVDSHQLKKFSFRDYIDSKLNYNVRLVLILDNNCDLKTKENLEDLRNFIKTLNNIISIYTINQDNFSVFEKKFHFFFLNNTSTDIEKNLALSNFPLLILDGLLYTGNFLNSKNKYQLENLKIKTVVSLLKEKDEILEKNLENFFFF